MGRKPRTLSFFKILLGDFAEKLRIPSAFVDNFHGKFIDESILKCGHGRIWPVEVKKDHVGKLFFQKGWLDFVKDNSLEAGDFLVFRYNGNSTFDVQIFGKSGCEKVGKLMHKIKYRKAKGINHKAVCQCKYIALNQQDNSVPQAKEMGGKIHSEERTAAGIKTKMVFRTFSCPLKLKHPHFTARWTSCKPYTVKIPQAFVREYGLTRKQSRLFRDPNGELWPVNITHSSNRGDFGSGCLDFWVGNNLVEGDRCIFEFIQGDENVIQVHIIRAKE